MKEVSLIRSAIWRRNIPLYLMFAPIIVFFITFKYVPMFGSIMAFKHYNFGDGILHSPWVGLENFRVLFSTPATIQIIRNTLLLSLLAIFIGFPFPILLAIMLNEVRAMWFKKIVQTLIFLPHFFSWIIVAGIIVTVFSQQAGFSAIVYLAALSSIDASLYEAASLDGANKWKQIWHVTLPGISSTVVLMFILAIGRVMEVGFDQVFMLQNSTVSNISEVISTYIYKIGLMGSQFSLSAAIGLFESFVSLILVVITNRIARKFGNGLW
jgi:putative aldouronate transport system permease protein